MDSSIGPGRKKNIKRRLEQYLDINEKNISPEGFYDYVRANKSKKDDKVYPKYSIWGYAAPPYNTIGQITQTQKQDPFMTNQIIPKIQYLNKLLTLIDENPTLFSDTKPAIIKKLNKLELTSKEINSIKDSNSLGELLKKLTQETQFKKNINELLALPASDKEQPQLPSTTSAPQPARGSQRVNKIQQIINFLEIKKTDDVHKLRQLLNKITQLPQTTEGKKDNYISLLLQKLTQDDKNKFKELLSPLPSPSPATQQPPASPSPQQQPSPASQPPKSQYKFGSKVSKILESKQHIKNFLKENVKQDYINQFEKDTTVQKTLQGLARFLYKKDKQLDLTPLVIQYSKAQTKNRTIKRQNLGADITFESIKEKFKKLSELGFVKKISLLSDIVRLAEHEYALLGELQVPSSQQHTSVLNTIAKTTTKPKEGVKQKQKQVKTVFDEIRNNVKELDDMFKIVFIDIFTQGAPFLKNILTAYGV